jgi:transposase
MSYITVQGKCLKDYNRRMETITLNKKQQRRAEVLAKVASGGISKTDAGDLLGLGRRQINRLLRGYEVKGLSAVVHGNTGRPPANKTPQSLIDKLLQLAGEEGKYHGLNVCHLHDLLKQREDILISRPVIYRSLIQKGVIQTGKRKPISRRQRRERAEREGMLLQIDGSPHDWLCRRGPKMTLMGAIDDATGNLVYALFRPTEDQAGYIMMLRSIALSYGLPACMERNP